MFSHNQIAALAVPDGADQRPEELGLALPGQVRDSGHGGDHFRNDEHGDEIWRRGRCLIPGPSTAGYVLTSGNAPKAWLGLLNHALGQGEWVEADARSVVRSRPAPPYGQFAQWHVDLLKKSV